MGDELGRCYDCGEWDYGGEFEDREGNVFHLCRPCAEKRSDVEEFDVVGDDAEFEMEAE